MWRRNSTGQSLHADGTLELAVQAALESVGDRLLAEVRQELRAGLQEIKTVVNSTGSEQLTRTHPSNSVIGNDDSDMFQNSERPQVHDSDGEESFPYSSEHNYTMLLDGSSFQQNRKKLRGDAVLKRLHSTVHNNQLLHSASSTNFQAFVKSSAFESLAGSLVMINAVFLGIETNMDCIYHLHPPLLTRSILESFEFLFTCFFLAEWILRLVVHGRHQFFYGNGWAWHWFDTLIVGMQVIDQIVTLTFVGAGNLDFFTLLRIMRMLRILRILRLLHLFEELDLLVRSIIMSTSALFWSLVLMATLVYCFGVLFAQRAFQSSAGDPSERVKYWFGTVPRTALTLLECLIGGVSWDEPVMLLFNEVDLFTGSCFTIYVSIGLFVLLNVVTGVFIDKAMKTAASETDLKIAAALARAFGLASDSSEADEVTWDVFEKKLEEPGMAEYFESIGMDNDHAMGFFKLLDADGSGSLSAREVVSGCLRLRGPARAVDVALLAQDQVKMNEKLEVHIQSVEHHLSLLLHKLHSMQHRKHSTRGSESNSFADFHKRPKISCSL